MCSGKIRVVTKLASIWYDFVDDPGPRFLNFPLNCYTTALDAVCGPWRVEKHSSRPVGVHDLHHSRRRPAALPAAISSFIQLSGRFGVLCVCVKGKKKRKKMERKRKEKKHKCTHSADERFECCPNVTFYWQGVCWRQCLVAGPCCPMLATRFSPSDCRRFTYISWFIVHGVACVSLPLCMAYHFFCGISCFTEWPACFSRCVSHAAFVVCYPFFFLRVFFSSGPRVIIVVLTSCARHLRAVAFRFPVFSLLRMDRALSSSCLRRLYATLAAVALQVLHFFRFHPVDDVLSL